MTVGRDVQLTVGLGLLWI